MAKNSPNSGDSSKGLQQSGNMNYSFSSRLFYNKSRVKKDGLATVYLMFIYRQKKKPINMGIEWPAHLIDLKNEILLPRERKDPDCSDFNLIIKNEKAKFIEVFKIARLQGVELTFKEVLKEYENKASREDFIQYAFSKIQERFINGEIADSTARSHKSSIQTLFEFRVTLPFSEINQDFLKGYKAYMYHKKNYDSDTSHTKLKNLRIYLNLARREGFVFKYPFGHGFKMPQEERRVEYLNEDEFQVLKKYFYSGQLTLGTNKEKALRAFLFICYTGVRLGDIKDLSHNHIRRGSLVFIPNKSDADHQHEISIPLHEEAKKLIVTRKGKLFELPPDSKFREKLTEVRHHLGIESKVSPHIGRHTFATRFLASGGRLEVLQQLLGHKKITTTMIYVHVSEDMKRDEINNLK